MKWFCLSQRRSWFIICVHRCGTRCLNELLLSDLIKKFIGLDNLELLQFHLVCVMWHCVYSVFVHVTKWVRFILTIQWPFDQCSCDCMWQNGDSVKPNFNSVDLDDIELLDVHAEVRFTSGVLSALLWPRTKYNHYRSKLLCAISK